MPRRILSRLLVSLAALATLLVPASARAQDDGGQEIEIPGGVAVHGTVLPGVTADHLALHDTATAATVQVVVNPSTRIRRSRTPIHLGDIHPGETIFAFGTLDDAHHTLHALVVGVLDSADLKRAEEDLGKTYITGTVVSINDLRLAIRRPDGVQQTIAVDENTSFRRGERRRNPTGGGLNSPEGTDTPPRAPAATEGESLTLADVHPGAYILANGALQRGVFVPAVLRIFPPLATTNAGHPRAGTSPERPQ